MNTVEIITLVIAAFALIVSILAFLDVKLIKNNFKTVASNASAITELTINERITATKEKVSDVCSMMIPFTSKPIATRTALENTMIEAFNKQLDLAIENNLNAYEAACSNYLDKKVDQVRLKKLLKSEIKNLVENENLKKYFDGVSSKYKAILKVYKDWEDLEK